MKDVVTHASFVEGHGWDCATEGACGHGLFFSLVHYGKRGGGVSIW